MKGYLTQIVVAVLAAIATQSATAAPLSLSTAPLTVSTTVQPNVMWLIDNSGSMRNVVYDIGYNSSTSYTQWSTTVWKYSRWSGWYQTTETYSSGRNYDVKDCVTATSGSNTRTLCFRSTSISYDGNYLNYLFTNFGVNGQSVDLSNKEGFTRLETVQKTAIAVTSKIDNMRFGLAKLGGDNNTTQGGTIVLPCKSGQSLETEINKLTPYTWTPLAEALYEVTRYYRGLSPYYNTDAFPKWDGTNTSPIQYRCQKNFTIVLTDGFPTYDETFPSRSSDAAIPAGKTVQNWDGNAANDGTGTNFSYEGSTLYLDDVAKFAWDIDFKDTTSLDSGGVSYNDADFKQQNMYTYTVGFTVKNDMLQDAAAYGNGEYYTADDGDQLATALSTVLSSISKKIGSSSAAAANTGRIQSGTMVYQARYNSGDWSGQLLGFAVDTDRSSSTYGDVLTNGPSTLGALWDAGDKIPAWDNRKIITSKMNADGTYTGYSFRWDSFSAAEQTTYFSSTEAILQFLRGRKDTVTAAYRNRSSLLGDIVHSTPYYVGKPSMRYRDTFESAKYSDFVTSYASRTPIIYVGSNDGMLHGFDATTGVEKLAYIPSPLLSKLSNLSSTTYSHQYYADGTPTVVDSFINASWKSVLVAGLNGGGQGIYALDVTDPSLYNEARADNIGLWEFTDAQSVELGYTYSRPKIVKLSDGKWYAVFGNGYNSTLADGRASTTGNAVLFIVDLASGTLKKMISTGVGMTADPTGTSRPNGLATVTPIDRNGDGVADYIYGGDLFGNVWKFDVTSSSSSNWGLAYRLFSACSSATCTATNRQPITSAITVGPATTGIGQMVYFGTGKYLETTDNNGTSGGIQSFYALHDTGTYTVSGTTPVISGRSVLQAQSITAQTSFTVTYQNGTPNDTSDDEDVVVSLRQTSNNTATASKQGWYMDLVPPSGAQGERIINQPVLRAGQIVFTTYIPNADPCSPSGDSWIMKLNAYTGKTLTNTYDINNDGVFGNEDRKFTQGSASVAATGIKVNSSAGLGIMTGTDGSGNEQDKILVSEADGVTVISSYVGQEVNRQSWQQISR